jgi:uncharacterized protein with PQ loop repeat
MIFELHEFIGYLGSFLLAIHTLPQIIKTVRTKDVQSFDALFLWFWFWGIFCLLVYVLLSPIILLPLLVNYIIGVLSVGILLFSYYKYK